MIKEFQEFIAKGNVMDLAVGIIIGGAFGLIVSSLVADIVMPIIGMAGSADFSNYFFPLSDAVTATSLEEAKKQGPVFAYGNFITVVINFLILIRWIKNPAALAAGSWFAVGQKPAKPSSQSRGSSHVPDRNAARRSAPRAGERHRGRHELWPHPPRPDPALGGRGRPADP